MFAGPIIARELVTTPRPWRYYLWRASFACALFILLWTAWQSIIGWQDVRELGVLARFGGVLYVMFALLQLTLMLFFAPLSTAAAVAYEKDRRTFNLLLMTSLSDTEIVVGKLVAGLLNILIILGASVGLLSICALLGGISFGQVANLFAVTAASGVAGGAMGLLIALWRDRTFQSISLTILMVVFSVTGVELFSVAFPTLEFMGVPLKEVLNPYRAMIALLYPRADQVTGVVRASSLVYIGVRLNFAALIVAFGIWKLRTWNPGRSEPREQGDEVEAEVEVVETKVEVRKSQEYAELPATVGAAATATATMDPVARGGQPMPRPALGHDGSLQETGDGGGTAPFDESSGSTTGLHVPRRTHRRVAAPPGPYRRPWANPILWRELMTRAYGTKPLIIKGCYALLFALGTGFFLNLARGMENPLRSMLCLIPVGLAILSLVLINAQGVTALTSERDTGALDLLLVTELSPGDFIYGKLFGILYNSKEMVALPLLGRDFSLVVGLAHGREPGLLPCRPPAALPLFGHARPPLGDQFHQQPHGHRQQLGHDLLPDGRHPSLCLPDRPQRPRIRPATAELHDLHRRRERCPFRLAGRQEPVAGHRPGLVADSVLDLLLHHQPDPRRFPRRLPRQRRGLRLRAAGHAGSGRRRLRHRAGADECDPGITSRSAEVTTNSENIDETG